MNLLVDKQYEHEEIADYMESEIVENIFENSYENNIKTIILYKLYNKSFENFQNIIDYAIIIHKKKFQNFELIHAFNSFLS